METTKTNTGQSEAQHAKGQQDGPSIRGFASMDQQRQREIARKGGRAAHEKGTAHEFTSEEARAAGQKGGQRVSANREHMSRIGRIGGKKSAGRRQETRQNKAEMNSREVAHPGQEASPAEMTSAGA